jgi:acyl-homoserine-lactone acylase
VFIPTRVTVRSASVVEFGPQPRALSVLTYGESGDPKSPHFNDQLELFVKGQFKPSLFTLDEVRRNAESAYHPSDPSEKH